MKIHRKQKARQRIWPSQQQKKKTQSLKNDENPPKAKKLGKGWPSQQQNKETQSLKNDENPPKAKQLGKGYGHRNNKIKRKKTLKNDEPWDALPLEGSTSRVMKPTNKLLIALENWFALLSEMHL
jgi:hypothetical protein